MKLKSWMRKEFRYLRKRYMWSLALSFFYVCMAVTAGAWMVSNDFHDRKTVTEDVNQLPDATNSVSVMGESTVDLILQTYYKCGEMTEETRKVSPNDINDWKKEHSNARLVRQEDGFMLWERRIEDLAPHCKTNGFMSIDDKGRLTLYYGAPDEGQIIRTFFQIEIKHLESKLPSDQVNKLYQGIPVRNITEFDTIFTTYQHFAVRH
jgi:forespore regulator of the sigma-K checkpoint